MIFSALKRFLGPDREGDDIARAYARLFRTDDGRTVLEHLHKLTLFRMTDPAITADELRFLEGQRQLVLLVCRMAAKPL